MSGDLLYQVKDQAAFLTINREARKNAISQEMILSFLENLDQADLDEQVRAVCITGAGDRVFCSGADLGLTLAKGGADRMAGAENYARLLKRMARFGKPLVGRINGSCLAGGLGIMLSCDIVIARKNAYFWTPEVAVGLFPMMIGALLLRNIGRKQVMEMVLTGRKISAPEAERIGLITRAVDSERLDEEVAAVLRLLTSKSPVGIRIGKEAFRAAGELPFEEAVDFLCRELDRVASTEDAREGMTAFLEKREPKFKGR